METENTKQIFSGEQEAHGRYKIQINFGPGRSSLKDFNAALTFWESGNHFHGGGDGGAYLCLDRLAIEKFRPQESYAFYVDVLKGKVEGHGCGRPIQEAAMGGGAAYCDHCKKAINALNLVNLLYFRGTTSGLADAVADIYRRGFNSDADIYCKYDATDIRYLSMHKEKGAEEAHRLRGLVIYPQGRILKDLSSGATLEGRFKALFNA